MSDSSHPHVLREYALLADGERGAVVGPHGDIAWMCAPRWDSPSIFSSLIGGRGEYSVSPSGRYVWGGYYEDASLIWRSRWVTDHGIVESREALVYPGQTGQLTVLRRIEAIDAQCGVDVLLYPRGEYDQTPMSDVHQHGDLWTARVAGLYLRWLSGPGVRLGSRDGDAALSIHLDLAAGQCHDLVLEISEHPFSGDPPKPAQLWASTEQAWGAAVPSLDQVLAVSDTRHTYAVLRGMTSSTGGMVAAATTSLPEHAEEGRNYDYRFVWIRDQCYAGQAAAAAGADDLLDAAVQFVTERLLADGPRLTPAYTINGDQIPDQKQLDLPGYPGGYDLVGNRVRHQFQLDAFGEALLLFAAAAQRDRADASTHKAIEIGAEAIANRWREPDAGIWEIDNRPWTHSRLTAVAGLRAATAASGPATGHHWQQLAEEILADTTKHALHPSGYWQRSPDDPLTDAALLLPPLRGALAHDDPRTEATLRVYLDDLTRDGYAYRFRHDSRPLHEAEGSFLLCGFLTALALHQQGDAVLARSWFERTRSACGPPQLFSEEYDQLQHQMRGNLPQAFVHALMLETAATLR